MGSRTTTRASLGAVQETDTQGQLSIGAAPLGYPLLNAEKMRIPPRDVRTNLAQKAALDRTQPVLGNRIDTSRMPRAPRGWRHRMPKASQRVASPASGRYALIPGNDATRAAAIVMFGMSMVDQNSTS
jgi:hypothetical protein